MSLLRQIRLAAKEGHEAWFTFQAVEQRGHTLSLSHTQFYVAAYFEESTIYVKKKFKIVIHRNAFFLCSRLHLQICIKSKQCIKQDVLTCPSDRPTCIAQISKPERGALNAALACYNYTLLFKYIQVLHKHLRPETAFSTHHPLKVIKRVH